MNIADMSLNLYSFGYSAGFINDPNNHSTSISLNGLVERSRSLELGGIEFPFDRFYALGNLHEGVDFLKNLNDQNINFYLDFENFDTSYLKKLIPILSKENIKSARIKMDQYGETIYGGNRFRSKSFKDAKKDFIKKLTIMSCFLKEYDFTLAIENHQDLSSIELIEIISEIDSDFIGINWDIGNSISCLDTPDSFYDRTKDFIRNVHLKDYKVFESEQGIRLVRCPIGDGYVDFKKLLKLIYRNENITSYSIELGAQITRESFIKQDAYWNEFDSHPIKKSDFFEFVNTISLQHGSSLSAFEEGFTGKALIESEDSEVRKSVANLSKISEQI